jgi:hypothetical protein
VWEVFAALALIFWRALCYPVAGLWQDWTVLLCVYWIYTVLRFRGRDWPFVTAAAMSGLLVLYGRVQIPLALTALDLRP